jgi:hypothetical protein
MVSLTLSVNSISFSAVFSVYGPYKIEKANILKLRFPSRKPFLCRKAANSESIEL